MRTRAWAVFLVAGVAMIVVYYAVPGPEAKDVVFLVIGTATVGAALAGLGMHRPRPMTPFMLITAGLVLYVGADTIWSFYEVVLHQAPPYPGIADIAYLAVYPAQFAGTWMLVRGARDRRGIGLEAWVIGAGVGVLIWQFLMAPAVTDTSSPIAARLVSAAYLAADLLLVALITRLVLLGLWRNTALLLIEGAFLAYLTADLLFGMDALAGDYYTGIWYDAGWALQYLLLGAALLHPSVTQIAAQVRAAEPTRVRPRLVALAVAGLVAPIVLAVEAVKRDAPDLLVVAAIWAVLFLLVVTRMRDLMGTLDSLFRQMRHRAHHDPLTGLENRTSFTERVEAALASPDPQFAIAYLDLNAFKAVNDADGHLAGDTVLVTVADRLRESVRRQDAVARVGGDEFAVFAPDVTTEQQEDAIGHRLVAALADPVPAAEGDAPIGASIGIATAKPGDTFDALLARADAAMYRAKRRQSRSHHPTLSTVSR